MSDVIRSSINRLCAIVIRCADKGQTARAGRALDAALRLRAALKALETKAKYPLR
jgi:hypothetical protein